MVKRAQYEHAIAVLIGKPPAELTIPAMPINIQAPALPPIPGALPSQLLERCPDIAAEERRIAAANEQIGIAQAALSLGGCRIRGHLCVELAQLAKQTVGSRSDGV